MSKPMNKKQIQKYKDELKDLQIEFLKSLNKELLEERNWQPIKTAPKNDEKRIMLYGYLKSKWTSQTTYRHIHIGFYEPSKLYPKFDWVVMSFGKIDLRLKATHWMPLPELPIQ